MKKTITLSALFLLMSLASFAQTTTYTFAGGGSSYFEISPTYGTPSPIYQEVNNLTFDGVSYGTDNGATKFTYGVDTGLITLPQALGYPNNGFIDGCTFTYDSPMWTKGNGKTVGDTFSISGSAACVYSVNITTFTQNYQVTSLHTYRGVTTSIFTMVGGSGTVVH